ncbi:hypothetical protein HG536_0C05650 [Torulaspora globosa]|uniref:L-lactate dehydrogenase (cytochrome) n=1 Tax=Torulaspora globosa TaxID=48254 RepID=A0A7G3ZFW0_9SACH|nr:uncharacterized protein HG536_0C05650 [Torulaspora globosa]QLL32396.1 hypothetical protein HG536_0C05650 [Torulaspora globosa]
MLLGHRAAQAVVRCVRRPVCRGLGVAGRRAQGIHTYGGQLRSRRWAVGAGCTLAALAAVLAKSGSDVIDNGTVKDMSKRAVKPEEVKKHNSVDDCWVVIDGYVYDLSDFIPSHPGGPAVIRDNAGKDVTAIFEPIHAPDVIEKFIAPNKRLGPLEGEMPDELVCPPFAPGESIADLAAKQQLRAQLPSLDHISNLYDFEYLASQILSNQAWAYYSSGADDEITMRENHSAYHRIFFKPRVLVDVEHVDTSTEFLGQKVDLPFYVSATALCKLGNPKEGEKDIARGCGMGPKKVVQMISTLASCSLQEIVEAAPSKDQIQWFQLYVNSDRKVTDELIAEAQRLGLKALFITVDAPSLGNREKDAKVKFSAEKLGPKAMEQNKEDKEKPKEVAERGASRALSKFIDPSLSWKDIIEIKKKTKLPIVIKGVQRSEDVLKAAEVGVAGVVLSNHGGRQLDFARSPVEVLAEVAPILREKKLGDSFEIYIDGGVRRGSDILKALCLGAKGVGLGRPFLYANSTYGKEGVQKLIETLSFELEMDMRLLGVNSIKELSPDFLDLSALKARSVEVPRDYLQQQAYQKATLADFET